jgi:hypothetical protein
MVKWFLMIWESGGVNGGGTNFRFTNNDSYVCIHRICAFPTHPVNVSVNCAEAEHPLLPVKRTQPTICVSDSAQAWNDPLMADGSPVAGSMVCPKY